MKTMFSSCFALVVVATGCAMNPSASSFVKADGDTPVGHSTKPFQVSCSAAGGYYGSIDVSDAADGSTVRVRSGVELNASQFVRDLGLSTRHVSDLTFVFPSSSCKASQRDPVEGICAAANVPMTSKGDDGPKTVNLDQVSLDLKRVTDTTGENTKIEATLSAARADNGRTFEARTGQRFETQGDNALSVCSAR